MISPWNLHVGSFCGSFESHFAVGPFQDSPSSFCLTGAAKAKAAIQLPGTESRGWGAEDWWFKQQKWGENMMKHDETNKIVEHWEFKDI